MSKNKSKGKKSDKFTEIVFPIEYLATLSPSGDEDLDISIHRHIALEGTRTEYPIELNAWEARKLGRALITAAKRLDGGK